MANGTIKSCHKGELLQHSKMYNLFLLTAIDGKRFEPRAVLDRLLHTRRKGARALTLTWRATDDQRPVFGDLQR
jgi:hypothetical protein